MIRQRSTTLTLTVTCTTLVIGFGFACQDTGTWSVHDMNRPQPAVVTPGAPACADQPGSAPSDAIVLFDGRNLDAWRTGGGAAAWTVQDGIARVKGGDIHTRANFGDCQLHLEWRVPPGFNGEGQGGGNSGVFFNDKYEIQILNGYENTTYADGSGGSFYGQHPPLVNPCRPVGAWNSYDIIYTSPRWNPDGSLASPGRATLIFNGVVVQNNQAFTGTTVHGDTTEYGAPHGPGPIRIQDHTDPLEFRNIWIRPLGGA